MNIDMRKFEILQTIVDTESIEDSTVYLLNKELKILLPINMNTYASNKLALAEAKDIEPRPHIHNTLGRVVTALNEKFICAIIYGYADEIFYAYLRVTKGNGFIDIDCKPSDALSISIRQNLPIYVEEHVYTENGIPVTWDLIKRSLDICPTV